MIDLHDLISALGDIFAGNRLKAIPRRGVPAGRTSKELVTGRARYAFKSW
jgi:hypothetical protein